jgi:hypothetical protein
MEYEVYLRREVFEFLRRVRPNEREVLLKLLRTLGHDPYRRGDFTERDQSGRDVEVVVSRQYAVLFWATTQRRRSRSSKFDMPTDDASQFFCGH